MKIGDLVIKTKGYGPKDYHWVGIILKVETWKNKKRFIVLTEGEIDSWLHDVVEPLTRS